MKTIELKTNEELQDACQLINDGGQLSWTLTPSRLTNKLGSSGKIFGLYNDDKIIGTVGLKETKIGKYSGSEVGYLFLDPQHRNMRNLSSLVKAVMEVVGQYDFVFATVITSNNNMNRIFEFSKRSSLAFSAKSLYSENTLNYWIVDGSVLPMKNVRKLLYTKYV